MEPPYIIVTPSHIEPGMWHFVTKMRRHSFLVNFDLVTHSKSGLGWSSGNFSARNDPDATMQINCISLQPKCVVGQGADQSIHTDIKYNTSSRRVVVWHWSSRHVCHWCHKSNVGWLDSKKVRSIFDTTQVDSLDNKTSEGISLEGTIFSWCVT